MSIMQQFFIIYATILQINECFTAFLNNKIKENTLQLVVVATVCARIYETSLK